MTQPDWQEDISRRIAELIERARGNPDVAPILVKFLADAGLLRRPINPPSGETDWLVRFEPDGKIYTYHRTMAEMVREFTERRDARGDLPHSVHAWVGGGWYEVTLS